MTSKIVAAIERVASHCNVIYLDGFRSGDALLDKYGITTPIRQAELLAQILGETGGGEVVQENLSYTHASRILEIFGAGHSSAAVTSAEAEHLVGHPQELAERVYGLGNPHMARELGNVKAGDGFMFRGIGPLQSTGRGAAKRWGDACSASFTDNVMLMVDPKYILMPPLLEWSAGKLNDFADRHDLTHIRRVINGGYNGLRDCEAWFDKLWPLLKDDGQPEAGWQAAQPDSTTKQLQIMLNQLGADPKVRVDGLNGPATRTATEWFQTVNGLKVDGIAGLVTVQTMRLRLASVGTLPEIAHAPLPLAA